MNKALETKIKLNLFWLVSATLNCCMHCCIPDMCKLVIGHLVSPHAWLEEPWLTNHNLEREILLRQNKKYLYLV